MDIKAWPKSIDIILLLFLSFFTIDMVVMKPLMIIAGIIAIAKYLKWADLKKAPLFYLLIAILCVVNYLVIHPDFTQSHFTSFCIGTGYWLMSFAAFLIISKRVELNTSATTEKTIDAWFIINILFTVGNLVMVMAKAHSLNPYMLTDEAYGNSTGDYLKGLLMGPSYINMFINSFFCIYYLYNGRYNLAILATVLACLTTSNFANFIFILVLLSCLFILKEKKARMTIALQLGFYVLFYLVISNNNLAYIGNTLKGKKGDNVETTALKSIKMPFANKYHNAWYNKYGKTVAFVETGEYLINSPKNLMFGAGVGGFSSQLALRTSDIPGLNKSRLFQRIPAYVCPAFMLNHYAVFAAIYGMPPAYHSIRHFPSSTANQIAGEYGLLGILVFFVFYLFYFARRYKHMTFSLPILVMLCWFLLFDYLFEYLSVVIFFELFFLMDMKRVATKNNLR